jgi:hypothetical protein
MEGNETEWERRRKGTGRNEMERNRTEQNRTEQNRTEQRLFLEAIEGGGLQDPVSIASAAYTCAKLQSVKLQA